jgi:major membrane immunogen (membrane-anchored lipoprotein)
MKKSILFILCVMIVSIFAFTACGSDDIDDEIRQPVHKHTYTMEYQSDATHHYYGATCGCADAGVLNKEAHVDDNNDGICDVCEYGKPEENK